MRLFLLPISTRRTLLYCQKLASTPASVQPTGLTNWLSVKATGTWARWERKESGWQKKVVEYGNHALKRIPYEEWGLKSMPPLSSRRRKELEGLDSADQAARVEIAYPGRLMSAQRALNVLSILGTERRDLHRKRMLQSILGWPLVAPLALIPVLPNLPFFYLVYRAWSHWRALSGGRHIEALLRKNLITPVANSILDELYPSTTPLSLGRPNETPEENEEMILDDATGKLLAKRLDIADLEVEIDRAIAQVRGSIGEQQASRAKAPAERDAQDSNDSLPESRKR